MIASGLCMMGGCFALENGAAVDTYWPAESVEFSEKISAFSQTVYQATIAGGDSENDVAYIKGRFAVIEGGSNWTITAGCNYATSNGASTGTGRFCLMVSTAATVSRGIHAYYGTKRVQISSTYGDADVFMHAQNGVASGYIDDEIFEPLTDSYAFDFSVTRLLAIRSMITKKLSFVYYGNERTGICFLVQAMLSPGGSVALFSDLDDSLIEV